MHPRVSTFLLLLVPICLLVVDGRSIRPPKVYNALIQTDANLQPSRAFPVIQPEISYGYGSYPYSYYSPVTYPSPYGPFKKYHGPTESEESESRSIEGSEENTPPYYNLYKPPKKHGKPPQIPLNEFGFPPSLIPLTPYGSPPQTFGLPTYPYNGFPVIYDPVFGAPPLYPVLPPYGYLPEGGKGKGKGKNGNGKKKPSNPTPEEDDIDDRIKNNGNKNKDIPDVIPPPPKKPPAEEKPSTPAPEEENPEQPSEAPPEEQPAPEEGQEGGEEPQEEPGPAPEDGGGEAEGEAEAEAE